ncbi:ankyrin repeat domain-containing protein [Pelosinus baikalensis]|uniref:Ankyrin repeat domain-containing protein n=1 Tax=Pelosinus baikalensis TaxID=2892015 RepID=A0ABS8HY59_9FIRM|nr:ankyrin repeat domain-containing protein [Pelosinus baikalensis]MCC5467444.1 ankyrin repeat domain-containing protein [Pelosinus baikalensis]
MDKEGIMSEAAIDELLAVANKELFAPESASVNNGIDQLSATEENSSQEIPPTKKLSFLTQLLQDSQIKRKLVTVLLLLCACILAGGYVGYQKGLETLEAPLSLDKIIQQGITFEGKNLITYAGRGDEAIVLAFLDADMDINTTRNTDGWTALTAASFYKKPEMVKLLLEKQAIVNIQDRSGKTPLMYAAAMGTEEITTLLLEAGANPNTQDKSGRTALMEAYSKQEAKIAEILKSAGADPTLPTIVRKEDIPDAPTSPTKKTPQTFSSTIPAEVQMTVSKAGLIPIGMPLKDVKKLYPTLSLNETYIDGSKKTIANIYLESSSDPSLVLELSSGKSQLVSIISVYDSRFTTDKNVTLHSTVGDIRNQYSVNEIRVIDHSLYLLVKSTKMLFELDINDPMILINWADSGSPNSIPSDTKIKRVIIY